MLLKSLLQFLLISIPSFCLGQRSFYEHFYIQTDKVKYVAGETLWFKAYNLTTDLTPSSRTNLFLTLKEVQATSPTASLHLPVFAGTASGSIDLPLQATQGIYLLSLYDPAFGDTAVYSKPVYLFNPTNKSAFTTLSSNKCRFQPFLNNGQLVVGLSNTVAFRATDSLGRPVKVNGSVFNQKGEEIIVFQDAIAGIGQFHLTPKPNEQYRVQVQFPNGGTSSYKLPLPTDQGVTLSTAYHEKGKTFTIQASQEFSNKKLRIVGYMQDTMVLDHPISLVSGSYSGIINAEELPAGRLQLFVIDEKNNILANKTTLLNHEKGLTTIQITPDTLQAGAQKTNVITLRFPEEVTGSFSVAITDADKESPVKQLHLPQQMLFHPSLGIESQLLENLNLSNHPIVADALCDLFLMVMQPATEYSTGSNGKPFWATVADTNYISLSGKVVQQKNGAPVTKGQLNLLVKSKDATTALFTTPINDEGRFQINNLIFVDSAAFYYQTDNQQRTTIILDTPSKRTFSYTKNLSDIFDPGILNDTYYNEQAQQRYQQLYDSLHRFKQLAEVIVQAKRGSPQEMVNDRYAKGLFHPSNMARVMDLINNPPPNGGNILDFLQGRVTGLVISRASNGTYTITSTRGYSLSGPAIIKLFLDEQEVTIENLLGILPKDVALVKFFPPGSAPMTSSGAAGMLVIYTKKAEDRFSINELNHFAYPGYSPVKKFTPYLLSTAGGTLFWDPAIISDNESHSFTLHFQNNPTTKRIRIIIEGFTLDGRLVCQEKVFDLE